MNYNYRTIFRKYPYSILLKPILSDLFVHLNNSDDLFNGLDEEKYNKYYIVCDIKFDVQITQ
jgi:hypothetical protein